MVEKRYILCSKQVPAEVIERITIVRYVMMSLPGARPVKWIR